MFCMERKKKKISLEYRSDLLKFRRVMEEMRLSVANVHLELMNRTPFGRLFKAYHENLIIHGVCKKCDVNIVSILKCYDPVQKTFVFGGITATIIAKDIAEIFGLPDEEEEINLNSRKRKSAFTGFYERCLAGVKDICKKILKERILRNLSELYAKKEIMKIHELEEVAQVGGDSPKTPEKEKKIIQLRSHGGGGG